MTPSNFYSVNFAFINPNIFCTAKNAVQSFINLESKIVMHESNLFNCLYKLISMRTKDIFKLMHKMVLLEIKNEIFYITNEFFSK